MSAQQGARGLLSGVFERPQISQALDDQALVQAMLEFEAALARALCAAGLCPRAEADAIATHARADELGSSFYAELARSGAEAGNPVPGLVEQLRAAVPASAAPHVHRGATSQDVIDTAMMLLARRSAQPLLAELDAAIARSAALADEHRKTLMVGRTLLQHAAPITFGLRAAGWLNALHDVRRRLSRLVEDGLYVQLGGAVGTLAALGSHGLVVASQLARELQLREPTMPWHTMRLPIVDLAHVHGAISAVLSKIARDILLLAQSDVAEVHEATAPGRGRSSAMPHKQNPVGCIAVLSCTRQVPHLTASLLAAAGDHEHERAAGAWHSEWRPMLSLMRATGSAAAWLRETLEGLRVDAARMRHNLDATSGVLLSERVAGLLYDRLGPATARRIVGEAVERSRSEGRSMLAVLQEDADFAAPLRQAGIGLIELQDALEPQRYLGASDTLIDRALSRGKS